MKYLVKMLGSRLFVSKVNRFNDGLIDCLEYSKFVSEAVKFDSELEAEKLESECEELTNKTFNVFILEAQNEISCS